MCAETAGSEPTPARNRKQVEPGEDVGTSVLVRYLAELTLPRSSLGISAIIGTGLYLSTAHGGRARTRLEPWQVVRPYRMPFCVSSFAALIKGRNFVLVFDPSLTANAAAGAGCAGFVGAAFLARRLRA